MYHDNVKLVTVTYIWKSWRQHQAPGRALQSNYWNMPDSWQDLSNLVMTYLQMTRLWSYECCDWSARFLSWYCQIIYLVNQIILFKIYLPWFCLNFPDWSSITLITLIYLVLPCFPFLPRVYLVLPFFTLFCHALPYCCLGFTYLPWFYLLSLSLLISF